MFAECKREVVLVLPRVGQFSSMMFLMGVVPGVKVAVAYRSRFSPVGADFGGGGVSRSSLLRRRALISACSMRYRGYPRR